MLAADTNRILQSESFLAFADSASLDQAKRIQVARTLALHFENEASLHATAVGPSEATMQRHLVNDTVAHLKVQIPDGSWKAFVRSGLLPEMETP